MKDYFVGSKISTSRDSVCYRFPHKACLFRLSMINHPSVKHLAWETLDVTPCNDVVRLKLRSDAFAVLEVHSLKCVRALIDAILRRWP